MGSPKPIVTLADWRKAQLVNLAAQLHQVNKKIKHYTDQSIDIGAMLEALENAQLRSRTTHKISKERKKPNGLHWTKRPENAARYKKWYKNVAKAAKTSGARRSAK